MNLSYLTTKFINCICVRKSIFLIYDFFNVKIIYFYDFIRLKWNVIKKIETLKNKNVEQITKVDVKLKNDIWKEENSIDTN